MRRPARPPWGARGSAYDECPDDTTGGCAGYEVLLTLLPAG
jgi:hypothetical protein